MKNCFLKKQIAVLCLIFDNLQELHVPRGEMDFLKCKMKLLEPSCKVLHDTPENCSNQACFFAYVHNTQRLSQLHISPFFAFEPRVPWMFQVNRSRKKYHICTARCFSHLPHHSN